MVSWSDDDDSSKDVIELSTSVQPGFASVHRVRPVEQAGWAWRWSLQELIRRMEELIMHHEIPILSLPLLAADLAPPNSSFSPWQIFSDKRLLERSVQIFTAVLDEYQRLMSSSFETLRPRMVIACTLPARLRGWVSLDHSLGPILAWFLEPLPFGSRNRADIQLADISEEELIYEAEVSSEQSAHLRPGLAKRFGRWRCERTLLEIFESEPIADYVYSWLLSDLWRTRWHL
jgi:hypothetical protein